MPKILDLGLDATRGAPASAEVPSPPRTPDAERPIPIRVSLLDGFELGIGGTAIEVALSAQRLLAFLAVQERPVLRAYVAGCLWVDKSDDDAKANLRAALSGLRQPGIALVESSANHLRLNPAVSVDLREAIDGARKLLDPHGEVVDGDAEEFLLSGDILPEWDEDWVSIERERLRQLRLHALDTLCGRLTAKGRLAEAIDVGLAAVAAEPLRESAHRVLIRAHLSEGNRAEAVRQYEAYRDLLWSGLGVSPSPQLRALMADGLADLPADAASEKTPRGRHKPSARDGAAAPSTVTASPSVDGQSRRRKAR
jgi:DNA-binding SARP family transcriptional activator